MGTRRYTILDVFTDFPLEGNPVAVFHDALDLPSELMQRLARETNLSETVFLGTIEAAQAPVRIFTPARELPFAGHPVLGTAFVIAERSGGELVHLHTGAGTVPITLRREDGRLVYGEMEQPLPEPVEPPDERAALAALGAERSRIPFGAYRNGPVHCYVMLESPEAVAALAPDLGALQRLGPFGFSCFAQTGPQEIKTRMFGPGVGVSEDPATGSAAGPLAAHLVRHGALEPGVGIRIEQGAEIGRPSVLWAAAEGARQQIRRVTVGGGAVVVAEGSSASRFSCKQHESRAILLPTESIR